MKELLVVTYPNTKKCCYFTPLSEWIAHAIQEWVSKNLIVADTIMITDAESEELRTCTLERFYQIMQNYERTENEG